MAVATSTEGRIAPVLAALSFAAEKHKAQTRKKDSGPYISHPIAVAELIARLTKTDDVALLQAAFLHDVLEDTPTPPAELADRFGPKVLAFVQEVTDDISLPKEARKCLQVERAPQLSTPAKQIRIADKISNVSDLSPNQPADWSRERKLQYLDWAEQVVAACGSTHESLENEFRRVARERRKELQESGTGGTG